MRTVSVHTLTAWLVLLLLVVATPAHTAPTDAAGACKSFFIAIDDKDYRTAWGLLSEHSRQIFCERMAADPGTQLSAEAVRKLFDSNAPALVDGFWTSFRDVVRADVYKTCTFTTRDTNKDNCLVVVERDGHAPVRVIMAKTGGQWHIGYAETFLKPGGVTTR